MLQAVLKIHQRGQKETEQVAASRAAANEISTDAAVVAVLSQLLCICMLKEKEIIALQPFFQRLFRFFPLLFVFAKILDLELLHIVTAHGMTAIGIR